MKKYILPTLIALSALSISASAAFYSVTGLSMLFAGASTAVLIMASSLEISKLVIASLLYQYWSKLNVLLKTYLTIAIIVLVLITSAGIYGFLSNSYQTTATQSEIVDKQIETLEFKKKLYEDNKSNLIQEKQSLNNLRGNLSKNTTIQYTDKNGNLFVKSNNSTMKSIETTNKSDEILSSKIDVINDSIFSLENQILEVRVNSEATSELGPLKYLSGITGQPMDKIINWFLLVIIFVFDPLAISLVIAANFAFAQIKLKNKQRKLLSQIITEDENDDLYEIDNKELEIASLVDFEKWEEENEPNEALQQAASTYKQNTMDSNGDGIVDESEFKEYFNNVDTNNDGIIDDQEASQANISNKEQQKYNKISKAIEELENLQKTTNYEFQWKKDKAEQEIKNLKNLLLDNDNTIRYF